MYAPAPLISLPRPTTPPPTHSRCLPQCSSWNAAAYAALRDCTVAEAASALAAAGRLAALPLLLQRHPRALMPSALEVLSCIPETVDPKQYTPLLRQVGGCQLAPSYTALQAQQRQRRRLQPFAMPPHIPQLALAMHAGGAPAQAAAAGAAGRLGGEQGVRGGAAGRGAVCAAAGH